MRNRAPSTARSIEMYLRDRAHSLSHIQNEAGKVRRVQHQSVSRAVQTAVGIGRVVVQYESDPFKFSPQRGTKSAKIAREICIAIATVSFDSSSISRIASRFCRP